MSQEERSFQEYLGKIHGAYTSEKLSYFEHNLEVMVEVTHCGAGRCPGSGRRRTLRQFPSDLFRRGGSCGGCWRWLTSSCWLLTSDIQ